MTGQIALGLVMLVAMVSVIFVGFPISFTLIIIAHADRLSRAHAFRDSIRKHFMASLFSDSQISN